MAPFCAIDQSSRQGKSSRLIVRVKTQLARLPRYDRGVSLFITLRSNLTQGV